MAAFNSLQRDYRAAFASNPNDPFDPLPKLYAEDEAAKGKAFKKAEVARLENRGIMRKEMAKREENARFPNSGMPDPDWKPGIPADMLSREDNPWKTFYDNESVRGNYQALAGEGMPSPGGAHLMGGGGVIGTAGDAERSNDSRQAQAATAMTALQNQSSPPGGGGYGGNAASGSGGSGGQVTMSPGGNYSRSAAWTPFDFEKYKQAQFDTQKAQESVPSYKAEQERNAANFDIGTGQTARAARYAGDITRDERTRNRQQQAIDTYDRDIYRAETSKPEFDATIQGNEIIRRLNAKSAADLAALRLRGDTAVDVQTLKSGSQDAKTFMDSLTKAGAMANFSEEDKTNRAIAIAQVVDAARKAGINLGATPEGQKIIQSLVGGAPSQTGTGNPGYNAQQNSVR